MDDRRIDDRWMIGVDDIQPVRQTDSQTDRQTDGRTDRHTESQPASQADRQRARQAGRQTDRHACVRVSDCLSVCIAPRSMLSFLSVLRYQALPHERDVYV